MTYLITFTCYGSHLHGDERGSIDPQHNAVGGPARTPESALHAFEQHEMNEPPYLLNAKHRQLVLTTILEVCSFRKWALLAAHIRENHVHAVVEADCDPRKITADLKAYASRALNRSGLDGSRKRRWTRGGSGRRLPDEDARSQGIRYVVEEQGVPMEIFVAADQRAI